MKKIILQVAVTLDGFIEGPNGEYDWCFTDQDYGMQDFMKHVDTVFYGRKSYELMQSIDANEVGLNGMEAMDEYVFSTTLSELKGNAKLVRGNITEEVMKIKKKGGKDIWLFGGASLTSSLMKENLVDELHLALHPILLGEGKPMFTDIPKRTKLSLMESKPYSSGLVMLKYAVERDPM